MAAGAADRARYRSLVGAADLLCQEGAVEIEDACHFARDKRCMTARREREGVVRKRQSSTGLVFGLIDVVGRGIGPDHRDAKWPEPPSGNVDVRRPRLGGDRARRSLRERREPFAAAGPEVEEVRG